MRQVNSSTLPIPKNVLNGIKTTIAKKPRAQELEETTHTISGSPSSCTTPPSPQRTTHLGTTNTLHLLSGAALLQSRSSPPFGSLVPTRTSAPRQIGLRRRHVREPTPAGRHSLLVATPAELTSENEMKGVPSHRRSAMGEWLVVVVIGPQPPNAHHEGGATIGAH